MFEAAHASRPCNMSKRHTRLSRSGPVRHLVSTGAPIGVLLHKMGIPFGVVASENWRRKVGTSAFSGCASLNASWEACVESQTVGATDREECLSTRLCPTMKRPCFLRHGAVTMTAFPVIFFGQILRTARWELAIMKASEPYIRLTWGTTLEMKPPFSGSADGQSRRRIFCLFPRCQHYLW